MTTAIERLERRLQRLEDERAIGQMIASYGPLVDAGAADAAAELWATDGTYDVEGWEMRSRDDVRAMVLSEFHQQLIGAGSCHFYGPAVVTVDGDEAVALCQSILLKRDADTPDSYLAWRSGANYFRIDGRWQIVARTSRRLDGSPDARQLLADGVAGRSGT
jgi:hypothetical protein